MATSEHIPDDPTTLPRSAAAAAEVGLPFYFTGKLCRNGHVDVRRTKNHTCRSCQNALTAVYAKQVNAALTEARQLQRFLNGGPNAAALYLRIDEVGEAAALAEADAAEAVKMEAKRLRTNERGREDYQKRLAREGTDIVRAKEADRTRIGYWADPEAARARVQQRKADGVAGNRAKKLRTPPWATKEQRAAVKLFCDACPSGMSVDHIIPTVHHLLAGLHVLGNLQYLPIADNISKGNKFECTMDDAEEHVRAGLAVWATDIGDGGVVAWGNYADDDRKREILKRLGLSAG